MALRLRSLGSVVCAVLALALTACTSGDDDSGGQSSPVTGDQGNPDENDDSDGVQIGQGGSGGGAGEEPQPDCSGETVRCAAGTAWSREACTCVAGTPCGPSVCAQGEVCCNESCGICTPPDGLCTEQFCGDPGTEPPVDCSGIAARCIEGTTWSVEACGCVPVEEPPPGCTEMAFCVEGYTWSTTECACVPIDQPPPDDCSGIAALCIEGTTWSVEACACVPITGTPCGPSVCAEGEVCCNESCGICTPPDGACTMQLCEEPPPAGDCVKDADCALVDDYCGGCNCLALPDTADAPYCADPVACFAAPCEGKAAACVDGTCTVVAPAL